MLEASPGTQQGQEWKVALHCTTKLIKEIPRAAG